MSKFKNGIDTTTLKVSAGAVDGKVLTSDASGNASWSSKSHPLGIGDFVTLGHSLAGSYGAKIDENGWPSRLASALGADLQDRHVDGAYAYLDDTINAGDGGWATAATYLDPKNTTPPWVAKFPLTSIYLGHNDDIGGAHTATYRAVMKAAMRGMIGHARSAARFADNDSTVRTTGANETGVGSWVRGAAASLLFSMNGQFTYTTGGTDEVHIDVPAGPSINAIWIYTLTGGGTPTTIPGAVTANATTLAVTSGAGFSASGGTAKILDAGTEDFFTYTGKSTNTITGITSSGANAMLAHATTGLTVVPVNQEGGAFTVDVDNVLASAPPGQAFDTRNLGLPSSPVRITGHGWRIPIPADGLAHEVTIKITAINSVFYFDGWEIEANVPPVVILPMPIRGYHYELYTGYPAPPTDTTINELRLEIQALADEFDSHVFTVDADTALNKTKSFFYQPAQTTASAITGGVTSITVVDTSAYTASGLATITDAGTFDTFSYAAKTATTFTGIPTTGAFAVATHSAGCIVNQTDGMHLSDEGHEVVASAFYTDILAKFPRDTTNRTLIASQRRRPAYSLRNQWKQAVRAASVGNIPIATPPTSIDGVTLNRGDRILLKDQTIPSENGVYLYLGGAPPLIRDYDANGNDKMLDGMTVSVCEGGVHRDTDWTLVTNNPIVLGTTSLSFTRIFPDPNQPIYRNSWEPNDGTRFHVLSNFPRYLATNGAIAALTTQRLSVVANIVVPAGQTITAISFFSGATALATATNQWFSILSLAASPVTIRSTVNGTNVAWAANTKKTLLLSSAWTPLIDTPILVGCMVHATTVPSLTGSVAQAAALLTTTNGSTIGFPTGLTANLTLTTPPADGTAMGTMTALSVGQPYVLLT